MNAFITETMTRWLSQERIRFIAGSVLVIGVVLLIVSVVTAREGRTIFGTDLGYDFAAFYATGQIQNEYGADRLYDADLQKQFLNKLLPAAPADAVISSAYPPFVAAGFRLLALVPYRWAYCLWLAISLGLYLAGLLLLWRMTPSLTGANRTAALLLALSFEPFLMECWIGGQLATFGFLVLALSLYCWSRNRQLLAGMALAFCLYKPTLLLLLIPMLVVMRAGRMLAGFAVGALGLTVASLALVGRTTCLEYVQMLTGYARAATGTGEVFRAWKFVDLVSFVRLLPGGQSAIGQTLLAGIVVVAIGLLIINWWRMPRADVEARRVLWAGTITATMVVNLYVGIYDTTLVVLGALLTTDALLRRGSFTPSFQGLLVLVYVVPWFSQFVARSVGVQVYTLVLAALAIYQVRAVRGGSDLHRLDLLQRE